MRKLLIISTFSLLTLVNVSHASLIGDSIDGQILTNQPLPSPFEQFTGPVIVGPGNEFVGDYNAVDITVNVFDSMFMVSFDDPSTGVHASTYDEGQLGIELTDLDWVGHPGRIVDVFLSDEGNGVIQSLEFTDNSVTVFWDAIAETRVDADGDNPAFGLADVYKFTIVAQHVPEPSAYVTWLLIGLTAGFGYRWRKRQVN